jgi:hypothetical protein
MRIQDEGYTLRIVRGRLVVDDVPPSTSKAKSGTTDVSSGTSGSRLRRRRLPTNTSRTWLAAFRATRTACPPERIINNKNATDLRDGLVAACYFSAPVRGCWYLDYDDRPVLLRALVV